MPPTKYPYAKNVRYVKSLQTRPGYEALFATGPLAIETPCPLPPGEVSIIYSLNLAGSGGVLPYTWSISAGALPTGLSVNAAGHISGTPTVAGLFSFTLHLQDATGSVVTKSCQMTVTELTITTACPLADAVVGVAYAQTFAATGGTLPYTWSIVSGSLPDGLSMDSSGNVTGTPTTVQVSVFTVRVTDSLGAIAQKSCQITAANPNNALVYTNDFSEAATAHGSNDLGLKVLVTAAFPLTTNKSGCNITHDGNGNCLHFDFVSGNGQGGITATADMAFAVPSILALMEDSDQLSQGICAADNSTGASLTRCGPAVFMSGTWNSDVPTAYYIANLPDVGKCVLKRINGSLPSDTDIGSQQTAAIGATLTISAKDNGASIRVRLFINGVLAEEVNDSSVNRIHLPASDNSMGWIGTFCSAPNFSKWTPLICAVPI